jgi:hypothetical protein
MNEILTKTIQNRHLSKLILSYLSKPVYHQELKDNTKTIRR